MSTTGEDFASTATVAGSSVAATEAEEDASSFAGSARGASVSGDGRVILTKEKSVTDIDIGNDDDDDDDDEEEGQDEGEYAAPMHLHALRTPAKLRGVRSRSSSRSRPGSRRNSASPPRTGVGKGELLGSTVSPAASVESSLDGLGDRSHASGGSELDPDILLDKLGFRDLDPNATQEELQELLKKHISSNSGLPTLNERMSEETMDDVHGFQDLVYIKKVKGASTGSINEDEDGEDDEEDNESPNKARRDSLKKAGKGLSSSAVMGSTTYLLNTLDEAEEEEGLDDEDEGENNGEVVLEIPDGLVKTPRRKKNRESNMAVIAGMDSDEEESDDDDAAAAAGSSVGNDSISDNDDEGADVVFEIPDGMVSLGGATSQSKRNRSTVNSTAAVASASSIDNDDYDEEEAEVDVPASVLNALNISNECKRTLKKRDTSLAVAGSEADYLEADEQDGLEADLASSDEEDEKR